MTSRLQQYGLRTEALGNGANQVGQLLALRRLGLAASW